MRIEDIIGISNEAYSDDGMVAGYFKQEIENGDTLAEFVARELEATFAHYLTDEEQLENAAHYMETAAGQLTSVVNAFRTAARKRQNPSNE